jgi:hypothetical protein
MSVILGRREVSSCFDIVGYPMLFLTGVRCILNPILVPMNDEIVGNNSLEV